MLVSSVTGGNSLRQATFRPVKPNWRESRTGKATELQLFARARELANTDLLMKVIVGGNCNSVERLARCCTRYYCTARATGSNFHVPRYEGWTRTETFL